MTKNNDNQNCQYMTRRIGSTTYKMKIVFSDNDGETLEEKILRMIRNEGLQNGWWPTSRPGKWRWYSQRT